jgi:hypothetical protein
VLAARNGDKQSVTRRDSLRKRIGSAEAAAIDRDLESWRAKSADRLINDPRAAGEAWKSRAGGAAG